MEGKLVYDGNSWCVLTGSFSMSIPLHPVQCDMLEAGSYNSMFLVDKIYSIVLDKYSNCVYASIIENKDIKLQVKNM